MPYPLKYSKASEHFADFLVDLRDIAGYGSSHQAYTTCQGVLQTFRRRLELADAIRFATILPVGLRALFVADWDPTEPRREFGDRIEQTKEVRELREKHNFSTESSIRDVAQALRHHVDEDKLDEVLATFPSGAVAFWEVGDANGS